MYCKNCNQQIPDGVKFCEYCGANQEVYVADNQNTMVAGNQGMYAPGNQGMYAPNNQGMYAVNNVNTGANGNDLSSILLLVFVVLFVLIRFMGILMEELVPNWYDSGWRIFDGIMGIILNLSFFLIPLSIKKTPLKVIAFIVLTPIILYSLYRNIMYIVG